MRKLLVWLICFSPLPLYGSQHDNISAWYVDSLVKVFPDSSAATSKLQVTLLSARNGHTSLQVALRSEEHRVVRVRVVAPHLGNAILKVQTFRVGTVKVNSHPTGTPLAEVVRSVVGPYPDPLFPLTKVPHRDNMDFRVHAGGHTAWNLPGRDRDRRREAEVEAALSRGSLCCNRTERTKALGDELALV